MFVNDDIILSFSFQAGIIDRKLPVSCVVRFGELELFSMQ